MRQVIETVAIDTPGRGLVEITDAVRRFVAQQSSTTGLLTLWCRHTSASLLVQENADPDVRADLEAFFSRLAPEAPGRYVHQDEGPDDMPAHIRAALTQTQISIPVERGRPVLGTWQGIYLWEHRNSPHRREVVLHLIASDRDAP
jgi:secondary thiamine-phosphate synthase enzyme